MKVSGSMVPSDWRYASALQRARGLVQGEGQRTESGYHFGLSAQAEMGHEKARRRDNWVKLA